MIATDGVWDPADRECHFLATDLGHGVLSAHPYLLLAVNMLVDGSGKVTAEAHRLVDPLIAQGFRILLDSGVFTLAMDHVRKHGIPHDVALNLPPAEIDGFEELWRGYLAVHATWGRDAWGMIELDQGGAVNKRITRAKLNDLGIFPMPVYHPIADGWDYFDELAETHDRLCVGNIVQAPSPLRLRIVHTIAERHRKYPDLWVHLLGLTPSELCFALPVDSADSSSWLQPVRFGQMTERAMGRTFGFLPDTLINRRGVERDDPSGHEAATALTAAMASYNQRSWRHWRQRLRDELGHVDYLQESPAC